LGVYETRDVLHFCVRLSGLSVRANSQLASGHYHPHADDSLHGRTARVHGSHVGRRQHGAPALLCPEYVLVADKVVYVISGKSSEQLIPLAEVTRFRLQKNEMLIRIDDADKMSHFHIKAMVLRPEWDRNQMLEEAEANAMITRHLDPATLREQ
jgi:hypothetical protein